MKPMKSEDAKMARMREGEASGYEMKMPSRGMCEHCKTAEAKYPDPESEEREAKTCCGDCFAKLTLKGMAEEPEEEMED